MKNFKTLQEIESEIEQINILKEELKETIKKPMRIYYSLVSKINDCLTIARKSKLDYDTKTKILINNIKNILKKFENN